MKSIVIVEDDKVTRETITRFLKKVGFNISIAKDGEEGLAVITKEKPQLVLLDVIMPIMNGFDLFDKLQKQEELKGIPVIFLTNLDDIRRKKELLDRGAVDYIVKSNIDLVDLHSKINALF